MTQRMLTYVGAALIVGALVYIGINGIDTITSFVKEQVNKVVSFAKTLTPSFSSGPAL